MIKNKNLPLYIALAIPVLMIILVAAFIYFPGAGKAPAYNFLYSSGGGYSVENGSIIAPVPPTGVPAGEPAYQQPQLYIYNVKTNSTQTIPYADAQSLKLDPSSTSLDGFTVEQGNGGGDFPFGGGYDNNWYIKGYNRAKKLNIQLTNSAPYYGNVQFIGWIE